MCSMCNLGIVKSVERVVLSCPCHTKTREMKYQEIAKLRLIIPNEKLTDVPYMGMHRKVYLYDVL